MRRARIVFGVLAVALVLFLNLLAASPSLHERFHADAGRANHQCAVTMFSHGLVDSPVVDVATIIPVSPVEFFLLTSATVPNALAETLPPGRAPPASLLHS